MRTQGSHRLPAAYRLLLHLVALGVPQQRRASWRAEWGAELWYVREAVLPGWPGHLEVARFCTGAFSDVLCLRRLSAARWGWRSGSASACIASLGLAVLVCGAFTQISPGVRKAVSSRRALTATPVVTISPQSRADASTPLVKLADVRSWQRRHQHLFAEFAFYQPVVKAVHIGPHNAPEMLIARASHNALAMLGSSADRTLPADRLPGDDLPRLVLSKQAWRSHFGQSPAVVGQVLRIGLERVRVSGIVSVDDLPSAFHADAWMLLPPSRADALPDNARVFALGRLTSTVASMGERWPMSVDAGTERRGDYVCAALGVDRPDAWAIFLFTVLLALLALPATTSLPLGEYPPRSVRLGWTAKLRRWVFLSAKLALLTPAVCLASMDLAYALPWTNPHTGEYLQLVTSFCGMLFGLRWCLRDQRQRCPVCLSRLTCPVRVGQPSRNFLAWHGTELICAGGHGLLHVPEIPTSWFGAPRWLHLDPSWSSLFLPAV